MYFSIAFLFPQISTLELCFPSLSFFFFPEMYFPSSPYLRLFLYVLSISYLKLMRMARARSSAPSDREYPTVYMMRSLLRMRPYCCCKSDWNAKTVTFKASTLLTHTHTKRRKELSVNRWEDFTFYLSRLCQSQRITRPSVIRSELNIHKDFTDLAGIVLTFAGVLLSPFAVFVADSVDQTPLNCSQRHSICHMRLGSTVQKERKISELQQNVIMWWRNISTWKLCLAHLNVILLRKLCFVFTLSEWSVQTLWIFSGIYLQSMFRDGVRICCMTIFLLTLWSQTNPLNQDRSNRVRLCCAEFL